ncbi:telo2-interacting protein 1 homolog [Phtheirospermum japonicum]|uniref:Telo2-interacting protein 1 homolog n=1 Tax=Phtheirospermum japonicum TaxID=374723 RepID=A0A830C9R4_9LAMI|nr:telo2-interacting protein 1 homolog [Phtheirospermum japonicum]
MLRTPWNQPDGRRIWTAMNVGVSSDASLAEASDADLLRHVLRRKWTEASINVVDDVEVLELDRSRLIWKKMDRLIGDAMFFVEDDCCMGISTSLLGCSKGSSCVYFTYDRANDTCCPASAMYERGKYNGKSNVNTDEEEDVQNSQVFFELRQNCIQLLDLLQNPKNDNSSLSQLLRLLQRSQSHSLQPFMDYTFFPLLLLFDAAVNSRSSVKSDCKDNSLDRNITLEMAHKVSDSVAESGVLCLEEVLKKCHLGSIDQMVVILKKLTHGAMLYPSEASEEFREGVIRCFRALILNLSPCADESCPCKQSGDSPVLRDEKELEFLVSRVSKRDIVSGECSLAFLQSEAASAAIGHWLSLLLKAYIEAARGHRGSSTLRVEALITLRVLVAKVGTVDALAFYLPGVVSGMGKILNASRTMISGAAGNTEALDQAVRGLTEYLIIVLEDVVSTSILGAPADEISGQKEKPLDSFLEELRHLPLKSPVQNDVSGPTENLQRGVLVSGIDTSSRINSDVKVGSLRECLCIFVCDDFEDVSTDARAFFRLLVQSKAKSQVEHDVAEVFSRLVEKLPQVVLGNDESLALSHTRKLLAVTYFGGPRLVADYLLSPVTAARFLDNFALCLSQNSVFAGSLNKLAITRPSSSSFMHSISEIKAIVNAGDENSQFFESETEGSYSGLIDILLGHLRELVSKLRIKEHCNDSWQSWYKKTGSGHLVRQASTAVCLLNEMMFGLSDQSIISFDRMFGSGPHHSGERAHLIDCIVKRAADAVLHVISATHNCPTVGHLVLANSDYIIDSVCRQLRHLDLNPHVPNVLSAMLSYVGVADKILPLLEEPMHAVSMELEILGRLRHPNLTLPFLKAVAEIAKASKYKAYKLPSQAESLKNDIISKKLNAEKSTDDEIRPSGADIQEEEWESILFKFNDSKRYRRIVGSIAGSCLVADGIIVLAKVEEAYKHESETKEAIEQVIQSCSFHNLMDTLGAAEDETQENRLLPAVNKIWPFLVACFRSKNLLAIRHCCHTISNVVQICGGDFFSRRFHTDGAHIWKVLTTSPFQNKPEKTPLQLPYRKTSASSEHSPAETSNLKVQAAILNMISDLAANKKSSSALEAVFKKISGIVVGIVCSGVKGLQDACVNALVGLASIDPDLIWLLLADVYYSRKRNLPSPPSEEFPEISEILPPPGSSREYLYVLYGGQSFGFDVDFNAVGTVFDKMYAQVFQSQMYK